MFSQIRPLSKTAKNILKKRYFADGETEWSQIVDRVINHVLVNEKDLERKELTRQALLHRYFVPNSPCLANAGNNANGLCACFVVDFPDTLEGIIETKGNFMLIAKKGGGCGTSLEKIRPEDEKVRGSTHGHAGGPLKFADTISHDAEAMTQSGFRSMALMFVQSVYHPDILKFINAKTEEGKIENANISVMVDDKFMNAVLNDEEYWTEFNGKQYYKYSAREIFEKIVDNAWKNGEPGVLFRDRINNSPYQYTSQKIFGTNPCSIIAWNM